MKKTKGIAAVLFTLCVMAFMSLTVFAENPAKTEFKEGDVLDVAHYNVASGNVEIGTMKLKNNKLNNDYYLIFDPNSFTLTDGSVSAISSAKMNAVYSAVTQVFEEHGREFRLDLYGSIDSESAPYAACVSPKVVPILTEQNAGTENNVWMAWCDKAGHVLDVYITIAPGEYADATPVYGEQVSVSVVTPKKMSIRLEDGSVLKSGDSFNICMGQEIKFQMCSNNWDNDTYSDDGNGVAGTVVYTVKVSDSFTGRSYDAATHTFTLPKGDLSLRTDVNSCFMAYRYHFQNGDYNKQTGIPQVVNNPLESLSVNLPLGSTIISDAYKNFKKIDSANVFIANGEDLTLSYADYSWNY